MYKAQKLHHVEMVIYLHAIVGLPSSNKVEIFTKNDLFPEEDP